MKYFRHQSENQRVAHICNIEGSMALCGFPRTNQKLHDTPKKTRKCPDCLKLANWENFPLTWPPEISQNSENFLKNRVHYGIVGNQVILSGDKWKDEDNRIFKVISVTTHPDKVEVCVEYDCGHWTLISPFDSRQFTLLVYRKPILNRDDPDDTIDVRVGDVWKYSDPILFFEVLCVHNGMAFCLDQHEKKYFIASCCKHRFQKLIKRDGVDVIPKGMELATHGIQEGDIWQNVKGQMFTVTKVVRDNQFRLREVKCKCSRHMKVDSTTIKTDDFHHLIKREPLSPCQ